MRLLETIGSEKDDSLLIDSLLRAFESAEGKDSIDIGRTLIPYLIDDERYDVAEKSALRIHAQAPDDVFAQMLLFEVRKARGEHLLAAKAARMVADNEDAKPPHRWDAALRYIEISKQQANDDENAVALEWLQSSIFLQDCPNDWRSLHCASKLANFAETFQLEAELLERLRQHDDAPPSARSQYALRLVNIQSQHLDNKEAALQAFSFVEEDQDGQAFVSILNLAESVEDKHRGIQALNQAFDQGFACSNEDELRARRFIVEHIDKEDANKATPHLERIVELAPNDISAIERLATESAESDPQRALVYQAELLQRMPDRIDIYRALHQGAIEAEDTDLAFLVEAALVGLGEADEDETYFYRQRRAKLKNGQQPSALIQIDHLGPVLPEPLQVILREVEAVASQIFPPDLTAYGSNEKERAQVFSTSSEPLGFILGAIPAVHVTTMDMDPTVEPASPFLAIVPETVASMSVRHQQCVMGALLARCRFGGVVGSPTAANPLSAKQIEYLIHAALSVATDWKTNFSGAVYKDIRKRLEGALSETAIARIAESAQDLTLGEHLGQRVIEEMTNASVRTAILCARDPAAAAECFRRYGRLLGCETIDKKHPRILEAMAFSVSKQHRTLRKQLNWGD